LIEIYQDGKFEAPKALAKATPENLARKKDLPKEGEKSKFTYQFDGLEFIPYNPEIPPQFAPQMMVAWQNSEGLSENLDTGNVYVFDLNNN
jgi:hypothetical protein